jgi:DNA-binding transcriptional regulator YbjK
VTSNREKALAAAIELLGTEGIRALTHLRVDERAALPRGSTSNYFRTRASLLQGVVQHMVDAELPAVGAAVSPTSPDELVAATVALFEFLTGPNRLMTAARLALYVEAGHDPELRAMLARGRSTIEETIMPALARLGSPDPELAVQALATCFEGLFLHRIAGHADIDTRPVLRLVVRACLAPNEPPEPPLATDL